MPRKTKEARKNDQVEETLFRRAMGYDWTEVKTEYTDKGEKTVETTKHVPADVSAMLAWLKNRRPDRWRDKPEPVEDPARSQAHADFIRALTEPAPEDAP